MRALLLIYRIFGRIGFRLILYPVMGYYFLMKKEARASSGQYIRRVVTFLVPEQRGSLSSFSHFLQFGEMLLDKFLVWMGHIKREDVVFETPAVIEMIEGKQEGGIIVVSHLGNIEICSALAHQIPNIRLTILVHTRHAVKFNSLINKVNRFDHVEMLQVTDMSPATAMILSERVAAGEYVVIAGDRTPVTGMERISMVDFLGAAAPMPQGAFILAGLLKCPVYLMFCIKQQARYSIYIEQFTERFALPRKERAQVLDSAVQEYAKRLQHYCLKAPLQWFNFYPFWGDVPAKGIVSG
ncbi:MAG: acetyltransferase [Sedimenticola sp.]